MARCSLCPKQGRRVQLFSSRTFTMLAPLSVVMQVMLFSSESPALKSVSQPMRYELPCVIFWEVCCLQSRTAELPVVNIMNDQVQIRL